MSAEWFDRLVQSIETDRRSKREISLAAGLGPNFVQQMIRNGKDPGAAKLDALLRVLGAGQMFYIMTGMEVRPEDEQFIRAVLEAPPGVRDRVRDLLVEASRLPEGQKPSDRG